MSRSSPRRPVASAITAMALLSTTLTPLADALAQTAPAAVGANDAATTTPIKHIILIIGENRTFDHVFATYQPKPGESVRNLLSQGIVLNDGTPGPNFSAG